MFTRTGIAPPHDLPPSRTTNPFWEIVRTIPGNDFDWKYERAWCPDWTIPYLEGKEYIDRHALCREYTYAIPDPASLDFVAHHLGTHAVEMGAGSGYWAWQLAQLGLDIIAYDIAPPDKLAKNDYHSLGSYNKLTGALRPTFFDVQIGDPASLSRHADRSLFLSWPPMNDMALLCLQTYQGNRLVYIGEDNGGCTANDAFFTRLREEWDEIASHKIIRWYGINDVITAYAKI